MSDTAPIRILVVDDHSQFRDGLRALLSTAADLEILAEATNGDDAIGLATNLQPDVILMDLQMPGRNGVDATRAIVTTSPHIAVLVLSMFEDDDSVFSALRAGARGYLLKGAPKSEIERAIRGVASGEAIFGPAIARRLTSYFATSEPRDDAAALPQLTDREREILALIERHLTNPQIAARLGLQPKTVRNHVSNIFTKLQVVDRAEAIYRARETGLRGSNYDR